MQVYNIESLYIHTVTSNLSMARNTELIQARNQYVRDRFRYLRKRNPKWTIEAIIEDVAKDIFLSEVTIVKILKSANESKVPSHPTMSKYNKEKAMAMA